MHENIKHQCLQTSCPVPWQGILEGVLVDHGHLGVFQATPAP